MPKIHVSIGIEFDIILFFGYNVCMSILAYFNERGIYMNRRYHIDIRELDFNYARNRNARIENEGEIRKFITPEESVARAFKEWVDECPEFKYKAFGLENGEWIVRYTK